MPRKYYHYLNNLCSTILNSFSQVHSFFWGEGAGRLNLGQKWQNCNSSMTSDNWYINLPRVKSQNFCHKSVCSHNIKHCNSQKSLWIISPSFLENLCCNWDCGINWIADQIDNGFGAALGNPFTKSSNNPSINVEKIIPSHSRFPWHTSRNDYKVHSCESTIKLWLA
uniref:Malate dehydrogenase n=1 Tax=Rhizophora mucronata TaxID=61149 RepID=A0A2P2M1W4_RHIMU